MYDNPFPRYNIFYEHLYQSLSSLLACKFIPELHILLFNFSSFTSLKVNVTFEIKKETLKIPEHYRKYKNYLKVCGRSFFFLTKMKK